MKTYELHLTIPLIHWGTALFHSSWSSWKRKQQRCLCIGSCCNVQEVEGENHDTTTQKHGNGAECPEKKREGEVESSEPQRPKIARSIQRLAHIALRVPLPRFASGHIYEKADMAIVPNGLNIEQKCYQKTNKNGEILDRRPHSAIISVYNSSGRAPRSRAADQYADEGTESDGRGCKKSGGHYVVPQGLNCQHTVLDSIRHHCIDPDFSVEGIESDHSGCGMAFYSV